MINTPSLLVFQMLAGWCLCKDIISFKLEIKLELNRKQFLFIDLRYHYWSDNNNRNDETL